MTSGKNDVDLVEFDEEQKELADFDSDGVINNRDLVLIARAIVAALTELKHNSNMPKISSGSAGGYFHAVL